MSERRNSPVDQVEMFCQLSTVKIAKLIESAEGYVCYAGPGVNQLPATAMAKVASRIGPELVTVSLDFDERVMRMGYGEITAVRVLRDAGIVVHSSPSLRSALIIVDGKGFAFTPTPLYLEAETKSVSARNALRLLPAQITEALSRLSPAAKALAIASTADPEEKVRIANLPNEVGGIRIDEAQFNQVNEKLEEAPPVKFDLARQVRVFESYLQYVELSLKGAAVQHHKLTIPNSIQKLGDSRDLEGRLRTTFDLVGKSGKLTSEALENELKEIRKNFTRSLGKDHGRVVLKSVKPILIERLATFRDKLKEHQARVGEELQKHLDESREAIIAYYVPRVLESPPDALIGQSLFGKVNENWASLWLKAELDRVFPTAESLIKVMRIEERFKDVTFETLNQVDFLQSIKEAYPGVDWENTYKEFIAAGEKTSDAKK